MIVDVAFHILARFTITYESRFLRVQIRVLLKHNGTTKKFSKKICTFCSFVSELGVPCFNDEKNF